MEEGWEDPWCKKKTHRTLIQETAFVSETKRHVRNVSKFGNVCNCKPNQVFLVPKPEQTVTFHVNHMTTEVWYDGGPVRHKPK